MSAPITTGAGCMGNPADPTEVTCFVAGINIYAGDMDDTVTNKTIVNSWLLGEAGKDVLIGGMGHDFLRGGPGNDLFKGGDGTDGVTYADLSAPVTATIDGMANDGPAGEHDEIALDVENLYGGSGPDTLTGNKEANLLMGNDGADQLFGGKGKDTLSSGNGDDTLEGQDDDDTLLGSWDDDTLRGGTGNDTIAGHGGNDQLYGEAGNDSLDGGEDHDFLSGGSDTEPNWGGDDTLLGGPGVDTVSYKDTASAWWPMPTVSKETTVLSIHPTRSCFQNTTRSAPMWRTSPVATTTTSSPGMEPATSWMAALAATR